MNDENSVLNDGLGSEPINFAAACLLFKSPWWAKAPEEVKRILRHCKIEINVFLNLTKPCPDGTKNRIGERCHSAIVIGFSHKGKKYGKRLGPVRALPGMREHKSGPKFGADASARKNEGLEALWYLLLDNGTVKTIRSSTLNRWQKVPWDEWLNISAVSSNKLFILGETIHGL